MTATADRQSDPSAAAPTTEALKSMASHPALGLPTGMALTPEEGGGYRVDIGARTVGFLEAGSFAWDVSVGSRRSAALVIARDRDLRGGLRTLSGGVG